MLKDKITTRQFSYIKRLYEQLNEKNIAFDSKPNLKSIEIFSEVKASNLIKELRKKLGIKNVSIINQYNPLKTLSNIMIKKEWIENYNYKENSILVWLPDYQNNRYLECSFPKGGRTVEFENQDGDWVSKEIGQLIYEQEPINFYNKKIDMSNWLSCGVRLDWNKKFRWISMDTKNPIQERETCKYEDFVELFEFFVSEFKNSKNIEEEKILKQKVEIKARKSAIDKNNVQETNDFPEIEKNKNCDQKNKWTNFNIWDPPE